MLAAQNTNQSSNPNTLIYALYGGLTIYFIYKFLKGVQERKKLKGETFKFSKRISKIMFILGALIITFGGFNIYQGEVLAGILMIALVLALFLEYSSTNDFAENGFIAESKFVEWNNLRKWAFDAERGELVVKYKEGFEEKSSYLRVKPEDIAEIDKIIKRYKLKK